MVSCETISSDGSGGRRQPRPAAAIFDLDGTLVDALPDIRANINRALAALGYDRRLDMEETRPLVGGGARNLAASILGKGIDAPETEALYQRFCAIYAHHPAELSRPFDGVIETLTALKERGVRLACVTAKPAVARVAVLDALALSPLFDAALSPEEGFPTKPAPDMLLASCRIMGVAPERAIMVGDTRYDLEAGLAAGCHTTIHISHGYQPLPDDLRGRVMAIDHFRQLLPLFSG
ncbi:MAG: HAD family hydrolase [Zetaproteobacteria bacterium]|nr:MAG: HAD family hydrolase [Zetaproteobacteria bacterium]